MENILKLEKQVSESKKKIINEQKQLVTLEDLLYKAKESYYDNNQTINSNVLYHYITYNDILRDYQHKILIKSVEIPELFINKQIIEYHSCCTPLFFMNYESYKTTNKFIKIMNDIITTIKNKNKKDKTPQNLLEKLSKKKNYNYYYEGYEEIISQNNIDFVIIQKDYYYIDEPLTKINFQTTNIG
jgi:hypothetical protein